MGLRTADCYKRPFHVVSTLGQFLSGHETKSDAEVNAKRRNDAAKGLDIKEHYKVTAGGPSA